MKRFKLKQYQTSVETDYSKLSREQIKIRALAIEEEGNKKRCKRCAIEKLLSEFRCHTQRRGKKGLWWDATCKDCHARVRGTKEIGKLKFAKELFNKGFRRCVECKQIKPLTCYWPNKAVHLGISHQCKDCHREWSRKQYHNRKNNK